MEENNKINENETNREHSIIYFTKNEKEEQENTPESAKKIEATKYIAPVMISILIYSLCAWVTKSGFSEIIDLELPIVILLTLILVESIFQGYAKITLPGYILISCISYAYINQTYSLLFVVSLAGVLINYYLEKIYYNEKDYPNINNDDIDIKSIFSHLKYYIILSFIMFVIFLLLGYFYPGVFQPLVMPSVENLNNGVQQGTISLETISLFVNNFSVAYNMIIGGFYFSISTVYLLIFNALFIGFYGAITDIHYFLAFTLPHGIIELSAIILAGAAGLRITHSLLVLLNGIKLNEENKKEIFIKGCTTFVQMFTDVIVLIIVISIMLLIAAFIEANLTVNVGTYLYNIGGIPWN